MCRVLKVRYYPNSDFLHAQVGYNKSFIWRSIVETQNILKNNIRRRVGNGIEVQVWADAWLPGEGEGRVSSTRPTGIRDMNVAALRDITGKKWNGERISNIFNADDRRKILSIPISSYDRKDGYWWNGENSGKFSVKRCYRLLIGKLQTGDGTDWARLWELHIPPMLKYFAWQAIDGSLPTVDNLRKKCVQVLDGCKVCDDSGWFGTVYRIFYRIPLPYRKLSGCKNTYCYHTEILVYLVSVYRNFGTVSVNYHDLM
ncbi:unnamed protein product [Cuscuta epithymum]|uniref:Reverse transcriptase zinc-binding domain-containing protein n=1 Tax=Cuscuta epithymum TaxID=186058 RepID=A0AAV0CA18_9ASTE|nr:unnamed protein product [Cuscuta epithymum]